MEHSSPTSSAEAEQAAMACEDAVIAAPTIEDRERLLRLAAAYWELAD